MLMRTQVHDPFIDRRKPAEPMRPVEEPAAWTADALYAGGDWLYTLKADDVAEIEAAIAPFDHDGIDLMPLTVADFPMPSFGSVLAGLRQELLYGRGVALLRGLPVDRLGKRGSALAFWAIGRHLGDDVLSQNARGHVLGHVTDLGQSRANTSQRGPYSREEIPYHVDCCDIVGLMCMMPAKSGGESGIASSVAVYNTILARRPDLIPVLMEPFHRDRREEIPPGKGPWYAIPVFNFHDGYFSGNVEPTYIGSAHRFDDVPALTPLQQEALDMVQAVAAELRFDMGFRSGDMQFLNNHVIFHTRQGYEDYDEPERKRHLLRIWLKALDGRPLPDCFYERHGTRGTVDRPGGIVGPDTVLNAPYLRI